MVVVGDLFQSVGKQVVNIDVGFAFARTSHYDFSRFVSV